MWSKIFLVCSTITLVLLSRTIRASVVLGPEDNKTVLCSEKICIPKCCESGKYIDSQVFINTSLPWCIDNGDLYDFYNVPVYKKLTPGVFFLNELKYKAMGDLFYLVPGRLYDVIAKNMTFAELYPFVAERVGLKSYLTEVCLNKYNKLQ